MNQSLKVNTLILTHIFEATNVTIEIINNLFIPTHSFLLDNNIFDFLQNFGPDRIKNSVKICAQKVGVQSQEMVVKVVHQFCYALQQNKKSGILYRLDAL